MPLTRRQAAAGLAASVVPLTVQATAGANASAALFPGEEMITAAALPCLIRFEKSARDQPLVVFVPGTSFLARIAYGFPAGRPTDFLSHWLVAAGFPFLGVSYPLDNPVYPETYPDFSITDWGRQVAEAARHVIDANGLGNRIIAVGWSMGGKIVEKLAVAVHAAGLDLRLFVALDALPPGPNLFPGNAEQFVLARDGLVDQTTSLLPWFVAMVAEQSRLNGHAIMSAADLKALFTGNPPLDLQGEAARFGKGRIVEDVAAAMEDGGVTDYAAYPPLALIVSNGLADYPNALLCRSNWALFVGQQLYRRHIYPNRSRIGQLSPQSWASLQNIFAGALARLTITVDGTHFLFVGEQGARATAAAIAELARRSDEINDQISAVLA
jgi:thioesterase domain-containing protein